MLVNKAKQYLGWAEPTGDDFFINLYNQYTGAGFSLNVAWCAIFVTVIARLCGVSTDIVPNFADCDVGVRWFKNKGRWKNSKSQGGNYTPKRNDIVFYSSGHTQSDSTHVGYVVEVSGSTLKAIEGNKSDAVGYRTISLSDPYIIGYGKVSDYIGSTTTDTSSLTTYTVQKGDTLSEIAKVMGVSTSDLATYNGISNPDVIIIYMGINDFARSRTLGSFTSPGVQTEGEVMVFTDAYELMLQKIKALYPTASIYCCTLLERCDLNGNTGAPAVNLNGDTVADFNTQIKAIAKAYGASVIDFYNCGINYTNLSLFTVDGIHPTWIGAGVLGQCATQAVLSSVGA